MRQASCAAICNGVSYPNLEAALVSNRFSPDGTEVDFYLPNGGVLLFIKTEIGWCCGIGYGVEVSSFDEIVLFEVEFDKYFNNYFDVEVSASKAFKRALKSPDYRKITIKVHKEFVVLKRKEFNNYTFWVYEKEDGQNAPILYTEADISFVI